MTKPATRPITLPSSYWLETVLPVISSAIPHQPDRMLTDLAAAIRERCQGVEQVTLNAVPERWADIAHRIVDEKCINRDLAVTFADLEPLRQAIFLIVNGRPSAMAEKPLSADERRHAEDVAARMDKDPEWPGYELEHAREAEPEKPAVQQPTLF